MTIQERERIENLVNTSPILSPQERMDWTELLDLMSDKQLMELEKILALVEPKASQIPASSQSKTAGQAAALSHILNMPNLGAGQTQAAKPILSHKPNELATPPGSFGEHLKAMLEEKELPEWDSHWQSLPAAHLAGAIAAPKKAEPKIEKPAPPASAFPPPKHAPKSSV